MEARISLEKQDARKSAARRRDAAFSAPLLPELVRAANDRLSQYLAQVIGAGQSTTTLAGYMPMRSELDPQPAMASHPGTVCVPVLRGAARPLEFHRWASDMPMVQGDFGVLVPAQSDPCIPTVLIVPMLAFDQRGYRLGYGGGYYDRTLQQLRANKAGCLAIGFAFDQQQSDTLPIDAYDQRLDAIITPTRVLSFAS